MAMKRFSLVLTLAALATSSSCMQMRQNAVGPIPPPAKETKARPLTPEEQRYYTLPRPVQG